MAFANKAQRNVLQGYVLADLSSIHTLTQSIEDALDAIRARTRQVIVNTTKLKELEDEPE